MAYAPRLVTRTRIANCTTSCVALGLPYRSSACAHTTPVGTSSRPVLSRAPSSARSVRSTSSTAGSSAGATCGSASAPPARKGTSFSV